MIRPAAVLAIAIGCAALARMSVAGPRPGGKQILPVSAPKPGSVSGRPTVRSPLGVYARVNIDVAIKRYPGTGHPTSEELHTYLRQLYSDLLADPAISGITAGQHWDEIQLEDPACAATQSCSPAPDGYDWSYLDDAFAEGAAAGKSVQLILTPGVDAPPWLFSKIPSCDGLFTGAGTAPSDCGTVTFINFPEEFRADGNPPLQPLPWNSTYNDAWRDFLTHLNARYGSNPAFVSLAIAGPICASDEFILPTTANGSAQTSGVPADVAWSTLIGHSFPGNSTYENTDQVFIDQWDQTIDAYTALFSKLTLFLSPDTGNDLPEFSNAITPHPDNVLFATDCSHANQNPMSCEAKTEILSHFLAVSGPFAKATQVGGMTASSTLKAGDIGVAGMKLLTSLSPRPILGGAEFDLPVSDPDTVQQEGCPGAEPSCSITPEEAAANVFSDFFAGTPVGAHWGAATGSAPVQYVDIDYVDVQYAEANPCPPAPSATLGKTSLQDLLDRASADLFSMAFRTKSLPPPTCH